MAYCNVNAMIAIYNLSLYAKRLMKNKNVSDLR